MAVNLATERVEVADYVDWQEQAFAKRWSDGLPVAPPFPELVDKMVAASGRDPHELLGRIPPAHGYATVETVAINAVMAGCLPVYFPVVLAAVEAMLEKPFNLHGVQTTQHNGEPLVIISGPAVNRIGVNAGLSVFGHGFRANGTIGRAIRLVMWNLGRSYPGDPDMSTLGHPGQWSYCIGEIHGDANPWPAIHEEAGFGAEESAVTVFSCEAPHSIHLKPDWNPDQLLPALIASMKNDGANLGGQRLLVLSPPSAAALSRQGYDKARLRQALWDATERTSAERKAASPWLEQIGFMPTLEGQPDDDDLVSVVDYLDGLHIVVAGGPGLFSAQCPGWGPYGGFAVTKSFVLPDGDEWLSVR